MTIIFSLQWAITTILVVIAPIIFLVPKFLCSNGQCTEDDGGCELEIIDPSSRSSITKEFKLYCSLRNIRSVAESAPFIGALTGEILFSLVSMNRKTHLGVAWLIGSIGCIGLAFATNIYMFIGCYFLAGLGSFTTLMVHIAILSEQSSRK